MTFCAALPTYRHEYPLQGVWPFARPFPPRVIVAGWPFRMARWRQGYPGVVAQYRESCAHGSMHLKIVRDGSGYWWIVDHEDDFNPDAGRPLSHFFHDYEPGRILKPAAVALTTLGLTRLALF